MSSFFNPFSEASRNPSTLIELLRSRALNQPDNPAYTFLQDGEAEEYNLTYAQLDRQARSIGAVLQSMQAASKRVLLLYPPGLDYIAAFFGCLYAGAIAVPAYPPRLNQSLARLQSIVQDARASIALTTSAMLSRAESLFDHAQYLRTLRWVDTESIAEGLDHQWQEPDVSSNTLAFLQYTSGSTSAPKGVMVTHGNLLHNEQMIQAAFQQTSELIIVGWLPLYHDMGLIGNVLQPLYVGAPCVLMSPVAFLQRPFRWLQAISRYKATTSGGPNFAYDLCARKVSPEELATLDLSSWRVAFNGSEPIREETLDRFTATFGPCGFRREAFFPCYGLAEATLLVSGRASSAPPVVTRVSARGIEKNHAVEITFIDDDARSLVSSGGSLLDQQVLIVNPESFEPCFPGEVGEIWVSGPSVAKGYWNNPDETERAFNARLRDTGEGPFLRTGDLGFIKDDDIFVTGRLKDLIIIRGRNHYPQDIELTVERSHLSLRPGCGAAFSLDLDGEERLVLVQEIETRKRPETDAVIEAIRQAVVENHEVEPHAVVLIRPSSIPKTSSGKIQRHECRARFITAGLSVVAEWRENLGPKSEAPVLCPTAPLRSAEEIEAWLVAQLAAKRGLEPSSIDVNQPIARYGLDSLMAIEFMHAVESGLGWVLPIASLLQDLTISQIVNQASTQLTRTALTRRALTDASQEIVAEAPLSRGQQALWFIYQLAPDSSAYNIANAVRVPADLNVPALRRAFQSLVDRHPCLRTAFADNQGEPLQRVHKYMEVCFQQEDATAWGDELVKRRLDEEAWRPFNLEQGPLLRVSLFKQTAQEYILLVVVHHIVADFWSLAVLAHELGVLYQAEKNGTKANLVPLALRYTDYVYWQEEVLAGHEGDELLSYWEQQLAGELPVLNLPTDRPRTPVQTFEGASHVFRLDAELTRQLKTFSQAHDATLFMTLVAAFQVLLYRHTGQEEILVGSPTAGRSRSDLNAVVGYFVNPVVLRGNLSGSPTFKEFLNRTRKTVLSALEHRDYPFTLLVERLQPTRDPGRSPLFQVAFALQKAHLPGGESLSAFALGEAGALMNLGEIQVETVALEQRVAQFDLAMMMAEVNGTLAASLQYNTDLFDSRSISRLASHFRTLLGSIVSDPHQPISSLRLLTQAEADQLIVGWNSTTREFDATRCIHHLVEEQARRTPHALAVKDESSALTYQQLDLRANQLARYLREKGVGQEQMVGVCLRRGVEMVVAMLGILKAGAGYVPLDGGYPKQRLSYMLEETKAAAVIVGSEQAERIGGQGGRLINVEEEREQIRRRSVEGVSSRVSGENLAYVIYTSGSTGRPKGVQIQHSGLMNLVTWHQRAYGVTSGDRATQLASPGFDASVWELWPYLAAGASVYIPNEETRRSIPKIWRWLADEAITICFLPTPLAEAALEAQLPADLALRTLLTGGDKLHPVSNNALPFRLVNHYGPTENTVVATRALVAVGTGSATAPPIGRPIDNTQVYLLDSRQQPVPVGVPGEIYIGGEGLARCYLNQPDLTAERFIPNPFGLRPGARLYKTGDLARYLADGEIEFIGRVDGQVKVRGYRIELGEVESVLTQQEGVREAVVVVREDAPSEKRLVAYLILKDKQPPEIGELRRSLKERLPDYMVPSAFVALEAFPLTPNGKIDRQSLPAPSEARDSLDDAPETPRTLVEELLTGIWSQILGVEQVGTQDDFFDLGGHSLLATQMVSRVRDAFKVELSLRTLFESPTVADLAKSIEIDMRVGQQSQAPPIVPVLRDGDMPLSFAQQRLWFLEQLEPGNPFYNIPAAVRLTGKLNIRALERALNEIVRRHESLRTRFVMIDGQPAQDIAPILSLPLSVTDLSGLAAATQEAEIQRYVADEAQQPFDLAGEPLLRVRLLQLGEQEHAVLMTTHHIISDGWSTEVFFREMAALYEAFSADKPSPLPELPIQYADFAHWQRQQLEGESLEAELEYWQRQLEGAPSVLELPTDRPRPAIQTHKGALHSFELDESLTGALKSLSRQQGSTLFMTLLSAFNVLLRRYTGQEDILVGTPIANRNHIDTERLIGLFVNTLVIRADLSGNPGFSELLGRIRESALGAYVHQELPFEKLVERLKPERSLSHTPLFQVMFAFQNASIQELELPDLILTPLEVNSGSAKFDLMLMVEESGQELKASIEYNTDLFDSRSISRLASHFRTLLGSIVSDPHQPISSLRLLTQAEADQLIVGWNSTTREFDATRCIHHLVEEQARRTPHALAVKDESSALTYQQLDLRANQLARYLREKGVGQEQMVGVCLRRGVEMVVAMLGILKAGAGYVPLEAGYPKQRLSYMLEETKAAAVIVGSEQAERIGGQGGRVINVEEEREQIRRRSVEGVSSRVSGENLAYVIYTSGSTGRPKGVAIEHRSAVAFIDWSKEVFPADDLKAVLASTSICFDLSVFELFVPLSMGGTVIVADSALHLPTLEAAKEVTLINTVPSAMAELLRVNGVPASVRTINLAGEPLQHRLAQQVYHQASIERLFNLYGPSEDTTYSTFTQVEKESHKTPTIGRPIANSQVYILDAQLEPLPIGVAGEIYIGGEGLARCYLNQPDLTAERFIPNPFGLRPGARLYKTGDLARYLSDGEIEFIGRVDGQVKVRGYRIELGEVESVLTQQEGVREAVVVVREDAPSEKRLVAYVVNKAERVLKVSELCSLMEEKLPRYMVPSAFIMLDALPLTPNGKVDRKALPAPDRARPELDGIFVAPRNQVEEVLAGIWSEILNIEQVGIHDRFLQSGRALAAGYSGRFPRARSF